jgi:hypothetical protein
LTPAAIRPVTAKQAGSTSNTESLYRAFALSVNLDQLFALQETELFPPPTCLSTYGGSRMLSTAIAMTVIGLKEGRIYFKAHAATEATAANGIVHLTS